MIVLGTLEGKRSAEMAQLLVPHADALVLTTPRVIAKPATSGVALAEAARDAGFAGQVTVENDPTQALERAMEIAAGPNDAVLVTGSLYLVGNVRRRWYPDDEIVRQQTPWPR